MGALVVMLGYALSIRSEGRSQFARNELTKRIVESGVPEPVLRTIPMLQENLAPSEGDGDSPVPEGVNTAPLQALIDRMEQLKSNNIGSDPLKNDWDLIKELLSKPLADWSPEERAQLAAFMAEHGEIAGAIRAAALSGMALPELDYAEGFKMELNHLAPLRDMARLLRADALTQGESGIATAMEDVRAILRLSEALAQEPILISQLVRFAQNHIAATTLADILNAGSIDPRDGQRLLTVLERGARRDAFANSIAMEGIIGLSFFDHPDPTATSLEGGVLERMVLGLYTSPLASPMFGADEAAYGEFMAEAAVLADSPYYEAFDAVQAFEARLNNTSRLRIFTRILVPSINNALLAQARHDAVLEVARVGMAVEMYQAANGDLPASLEAVAPYLNGVIPLDPFTGDPLRYRPREGGFDLYSVGQDREDDGGAWDPAYREGDILWRGDQSAQRKSMVLAAES